MKSITTPTETINDILDIFVSDNVQPGVLLQINANKPPLTILEKQYISKVQDNTLYQIPRGIPISISLTKHNLVKYYEYRLLERENGRKFYDKLILSSPHNICPYCTIKLVKTIDHFLPKSEYPTLSVIPTNLVPCCRDCNTEKKISYPTERDSQTFHPYFDNVDNEPWIVAELMKTEPLSFQYRVERLPHWNDNKYNRSMNHFNAYNINELFSNEANRELRARQLQLKGLLNRNKTELVQHLDETYQSCFNGAGILDWQTIMYKCLLSDNWFLDGCANNSYYD